MRLILALYGLLTATALAADYPAGPDDYRSVLQQLRAGDRLLLEAGDYTNGLSLRGLGGEAGRPISIEGPAHGARARFIARPGANTISLVDVEHITLRNLELDGRKIPVDAVKAEGHARYAHHVTLENLYIHDHDASQQNVGISSKCPAYGWVVRGNRIERVGTGIYLGGSDGSAPFVGGVIEGNHITDSLGYNLQIKHQQPRPADMPEPGRRHDTVIRHNFFSKESGGSREGMARPNVLVGHWPLSGEGAEDRYLIYANLFWQNPTEALFQGEGNVALYNNVMSNRFGDAINIQPHNDVPRRVEIRHNTLLARDTGIFLRTRPDQQGFFDIRDNLIFAARPLAGEAKGRNLSGAPSRAGDFLRAPYASLGDFDASPLRHLGLAGPPAPLPQAQLDYFGAARADGFGAVAGPHAGPAYARWRR